jgi:hypothetical protein
MEFKAGDVVWFIKRYFPKNPYRPFCTFKICKGKLKSVTPDVKVISSDGKTVLYTETHYIIKGLPDWIYVKVYASEADAEEAFKKQNLKKYYKC